MDAVQRIAQAIQQGRGRGTPSLPLPPALNPPLAAVPPAVSPADFAVPQQDVAPAPASPVAVPAPAAAVPVPAPSGPAVPSPAPPPDLPPSLAIPATQAAPGMVQVPQTDRQLAEWRALMDRLQFARQGA